MDKSSFARTMRRYLWLYETIRATGEEGISKRGIDRKWALNFDLNDSPSGADRRFTQPTFKKYLREIEELFNVEVLEFKHPGDYKRYCISPPADSRQDKTRSMLLSALAMNHIVDENEAIQEHIMMDELPDTGGEHLFTVLRAIRECRCVEIDYQSYKAGRVRQKHVVAPYIVRLSQMRWYVYGWRYGTREHPVLLAFEHGRMFGCTLTDKNFDKAEIAEKMGGCASPGDVFRDFYGVNIGYGTEVEDIRVRVFSSRQIGYVRSKPLHHSQREVLTDLDFAEFTYHIHPTMEFLRELVKFGPQLKVLSPQSVADAVKGILDEGAFARFRQFYRPRTLCSRLATLMPCFVNRRLSPRELVIVMDTSMV